MAIANRNNTSINTSTRRITVILWFPAVDDDDNDENDDDDDAIVLSLLSDLISVTTDRRLVDRLGG